MPPPRPLSPGEPRQVSLRSADRKVLPLVPGPPPPTRPRPLPDATAVRLSAVPDSAPPYDDDVAPGKARSRSSGPEATPDGPRPDGRKPGGPRAGEPRPGEPRAGEPRAGEPRAGEPRPGGPRPGGPRPGGPRPDGPQPDAPPDPSGPRPRPPDPSGTRPRQPDRAAWPSQFAQVLAETLAGSRPRRQIRPWATDQALRRIRQLGPMLAAPAGGVQPRVRRVVTSRPAAGVVEMTVIVSVGPSFRALAVRLERDGPGRRGQGRAGHGRTPQAAGWVCTAIEAA